MKSNHPKSPLKINTSEIMRFNEITIEAEIIRENDKLYLVKRNFFGKIVDKIECGNMFEKKQRRIIKKLSHQTLVWEFFKKHFL